MGDGHGNFSFAICLGTAARSYTLNQLICSAGCAERPWARVPGAASALDQGCSAGAFNGRSKAIQLSSMPVNG